MDLVKFRESETSFFPTTLVKQRVFWTELLGATMESVFRERSSISTLSFILMTLIVRHLCSINISTSPLLIVCLSGLILLGDIELTWTSFAQRIVDLYGM